MADEVNPGELEITDELIAERRAEEPGQTPEDMTPWQRPITAFIDVLNLWIGRILCLLILPVIAVIVFEVVSRNLFGQLIAWDQAELAARLGLGPTIWVYDVSRMSAGILFMAGAGYALMRGVHIRADFLYRNWSDKTQATVDASLYLAFYFPAMLFLFWVALDEFWEAYTKGYQEGFSTWAPVVWPVRLGLLVGATSLLLQGLPELFRAFHKMGPERESKFLKLLPFYVVILAIAFLAVYFPKIMPLGDMWKDMFGRDGMLGISTPTIGLIMLALMLFSIFVGFPISFTLLFLGFFFATWGQNSKLATFHLGAKVRETMWDDQLVAVPLFIFMGIMMEKAGLMERLFIAVQMMMSKTRGALFIAVLFVSTIFAAATGIVGASVTILGIMAARTMSKSGYDVKMAAGTITAGGTLGILIPPSIMLVVMGPVLEVPVTDLFRAAILPGIMLASLYLAYSLIRCWINPSLGPILAEEDQPDTSDYYILEVLLVFSAIFGFFKVLLVGINGGFSGWFIGASLLIPLAYLVLIIAAYRSKAVLKFAVWAFIPLAFLYSANGLYTGFNAVTDGGAGFLSIAGFFLFVGVLQFVICAIMAMVAIRITMAGAWGEFHLAELWREFFLGLVPPTILISFALGSILAGWATPAEASGCGAFGAILLSAMYRKLNLSGLYDAMIKTLELTVLIMFLVATSNYFGAVFANLGTPTMLTNLLLSMDLSVGVMLIFVMALVFLLGWPLEWVPIVLIIVPILVPLLVELEVNLVWFAILVAVNLQTAWLSPPVALSAYFLKGVAPDWDLKDIYLGMMQFMCIQVVGLILIFTFPQIALWLPEYLSR